MTFEEFSAFVTDELRIITDKMRVTLHYNINQEIEHYHHIFFKKRLDQYTVFYDKIDDHTKETIFKITGKVIDGEIHINVFNDHFGMEGCFLTPEKVEVTPNLEKDFSQYIFKSIDSVSDYLNKNTGKKDTTHNLNYMANVLEDGNIVQKIYKAKITATKEDDGIKIRVQLPDDLKVDLPEEYGA